MSKVNVAVVGAGVIGLAAAVRLLESRGGDLAVTVIAEKFHPNVTSNGAGGLVYPDVAEEDGRLLATMKYLAGLQAPHVTSEAGVDLRPFFLYFPTQQERPWWADVVTEFEMLARTELGRRGLSPGPHEMVFSFKSYVIEPKKYLPWLMSRFQKLGGNFQQRRVETIQELQGEYSLVVNCTGLGARDLARDLDVHPVRGQIVAVKAPLAFMQNVAVHVWDPVEGEHLTYIIPHSEVTLLGGTRNHGNWSQVPDPQQGDHIYKQCVQLAPALEGSEVVQTWACLRPMRSVVRLELDLTLPLLPVVHCYGHGGRGYILHWGCALEVEKIVEDCLKEKGLL